ncbi:hypothetical protein F3P66_22015 [Agrobacterium fabrum]|uniref:Uncharacterized protein n=1 Tax=Agrobacterium fabrum (strain C58 / ATCC 33970) TaxID=176299 RepID=Q8U7G5_AGRFC|nr:hypothetical protein Atu4484 [Agrobacterium fabrum str. C58]QRM62026.1 hypothetical protein F3P66_22015 [Agrobacterium fabrum]TRB28589.1 hypothetical protein EXN51_13475 [Agrobacterium fabrum]
MGKWWKFLHSPGRLVRAVITAHGDRDSGPSVTAFSRHLSDQPFPPLARRDAFQKHGLPEPCLSMPASGSQRAPRVSPFRSGCGRNDAAKGDDGDEWGRIFSEVTEKEGGVARNCPHLGVLMANRPPHPALRATFSPAGRSAGAERGDEGVTLPSPRQSRQT